jgi:hypothetical protein
LLTGLFRQSALRAIVPGRTCGDVLQLSRHGKQRVRQAWHPLADNLGNFLRTLALPPEVAQWPMTTLRDRLVKIGARIVRHGARSRSKWPKAWCRVPCSRPY